MASFLAIPQLMLNDALLKLVPFVLRTAEGCTDWLAPFGREVRSRKRFDANSPRRGGPKRALSGSNEGAVAWLQRRSNGCCPLTPACGRSTSRRAGLTPLLPRCPGAPVSAILRLSVPGHPTTTTTEIAMTRPPGYRGACLLPQRTCMRSRSYSNRRVRSNPNKVTFTRSPAPS